MKARRGLVALFVACLISGWSGPQVSAAPLAAYTETPNFVNFSVDHNTRTINVSVRIMFMPRTCVGRNPCTIDPAVVQRIVDGIQKYWKGHMFRCYKLVFQINTTVGGNALDAGPDRLVIRLDNSPVGVRSFVWSGGGSGNHRGNDPVDRRIPVNDIGHLATWWEAETDSVFAHEFGHLLGLDDGYVDGPIGQDGQPGPPVLKEGAPRDLMWTGRDPAIKVSQDMIDRVAERSGQVKVDELQCDYKVDYKHKNGWTLKGTKCDEPAGEWTLAMGGSGYGIRWKGRFMFTLDATSLSGPISGRWHGDIGAGATSDGTWSGTVKFTQGDPPRIELPAQESGRVCVNGDCVDADAFEKLTIELKVGKFC